MIRDETEASSPEGVCNLFRDQFSGIFTNESLTDSQISKAVNRVPSRTSVAPHPIIRSDTVSSACIKLKNSTSAGPDGIPSIVIKKCSSSLSLPLSYIFNLSLNSGVFPDCWKKSYIFPVFKKGCKKDVRNYRGIAALCAISKLFELIVLDFLSHVCSNYIATEQHGFMKKRSTTTNLLHYTSFITRSLQKGHQVDAVYTDLSAAFDTINHRIAIAKLNRLGFNGTLLNWLDSYLVGREITVKVGDFTSAPFTATSGVPQGSHLGPLIFLLYLNDVHLILRCFKLSYADDFKLFYVVQTEKDASFLQSQLDNFAEWCDDNRMLLNAMKCSVITFSRKLSTVSFDYVLHGVSLTRESCVKDLGIMLDSKLTFTSHVAYVTSKASKTLGFIFRLTKYFNDVRCLKTLYCSLVRSTLEYASVVWAPFYANSINRIERIQRKFARFALRDFPWLDHQIFQSYEDRCDQIGLELLSTRRNVAKAAFIADLIQSHIDSPDLLQLLPFNVRPRSLRSQNVFRIPVARTNYGYNEPISSMCRIFNRCYSVFDFHLSRPTLKKLFAQKLKEL